MMTGSGRYDRSSAVRYAHTWAHSRNPAYYNYDKLGGDCTNFVSQCLVQGAGVMNHRKIFGWYYNNANDKSPSWTGVEYLYDFLVSNDGGPGPYGEIVGLESARPGDIVQLCFDGLRFQHTPVIVAVGEKPVADNILVAAHTYDCDNKRLSAYTYKKIRIIHILGVR